MDPEAYRKTRKIYLSVKKVPRLIAHTSALALNTDNFTNNSTI